MEINLALTIAAGIVFILSIWAIIIFGVIEPKENKA